MAERSIAVGWLRSGCGPPPARGGWHDRHRERHQGGHVARAVAEDLRKLDRAHDVAGVLVVEARMYRAAGQVQRAEEALAEAIPMFAAANDNPGMLKGWVGLGDLQRLL